jgi:hypothetical protein
MIKKNCLILCFLLSLLNLPTQANETIQSPFKKVIVDTPKQTQLTTEPNSLPNTKQPEQNVVNAPQNQLGLKWAENIIIKTEELIKNKKINEAQIAIAPLDPWLNEATEIHTDLYKTLRTLETAKIQADQERDLALNFVMLRDKSKYLLGLIYIEEKQYQKAVKKLAEVVKSQPKTTLGMQAYETLEKIGFTYKVPLSKDEKTTEDIKPF